VTVDKKPKVLGRLRRAPENFVSQQFADDVYKNGLDENRRGFLRNSFMTALGAATAGGAVSSAFANEGDKAILEKQTWQTTLGNPVAAKAYGMPSQWEAPLHQTQYLR